MPVNRTWDIGPGTTTTPPGAPPGRGPGVSAAAGRPGGLPEHLLGLGPQQFQLNPRGPADGARGSRPVRAVEADPGLVGLAELVVGHGQEEVVERALRPAEPPRLIQVVHG